MCVAKGCAQVQNVLLTAVINRRSTVREDGVFVGRCLKQCEHGDRESKVALSQK